MVRDGLSMGEAPEHAADVRAKLLSVQRELASAFLERDEVVEGALLALVAGAHVLVLGPPGTAKSQLAHALCSRIEGARYFQWLLTRFSTPEEIFGAVSLRALERDDYRRVTDGKLPLAHIAFLDEVFKASSSILNALLSVMNERIFHNGKEPELVPLVSLFGASNELPDEDELRALYDRFLLRFTVDYLSEEFRFLQLLTLAPPTTHARLSLGDLERARSAAAEVTVPEGVLRDVAALRKMLGEKSIVASDRRYRQSIELLRARAWLAGRDAVSGDDLFFLQHVLWSEPEERREVVATLRELLLGHEEAARVLVAEAREVAAAADRSYEEEDDLVRAVVEALTKLRRLGARTEELLVGARGRGRTTAAVEQALGEIAAIERDVRARHVEGEEH